MRRLGHRGAPLDMASVRMPLHADLSVRPGLPRAPFHGIVAVLDIVAKRLPFAFRFVASANILKDEDVSAAREKERFLVSIRIALGAVRGTADQHRIFTGFHWAV